MKSRLGESCYNAAMEMPNPYQSPEAASDAPTVEPVAIGDSFEAIAKRTFLDWEKLRLWFNAVLVVWTWGVAQSWFSFAIFSEPAFWMQFVVMVVTVNLCFLAGPATESCVTWLGFRTHALRLSLFVFGTVAGMGASCLAMIGLGYNMVTTN